MMKTILISILAALAAFMPVRAADLTVSADIDAFLSAADNAAARTALGVPSLTGTNNLTGPQVFGGDVTFGGTSFSVSGASLTPFQTALSLVPGTHVVAYNGSLGTPSSGTISTGVTVALSSATITGNLPDARNTVSNSTTTAMTGAALAITPSTTGTINAVNIGGTTRGTGAFTTLAANGATTLTAGTASTSTTTGTLVVTGGSGVSGALHVNLDINGSRDVYAGSGRGFRWGSDGNGTTLQKSGSTDLEVINQGLGNARGGFLCSNLTASGSVITTPSTISGAGALNATTSASAVTTTGAAQALTLADGTNGQLKTVAHVVDGGSAILTPATKSGYSTITFTNVGDSVTLQFFTTAGWCVVGSYGAVITP